VAKLSELRSVIAYLRKEKEIIELQHELSKQENARLKTQLEYLSQSLQDVRATLAQVCPHRSYISIPLMV
jgi:nucleoprotein TPR